MPWCEDCAQYFTVQTLAEDGSCPSCGRELGPPPKAPWHFKLLIVAVVAYLGLRAWQGIDWVINHL